jgi:putative addiction module component (TIGR02574 family)
MHNEAMKISKEDIQKLSVAERIDLIRDLWDSIESATDLPPVTAAQKAELERRLRLYYEDPQATKTWAEVRERLDRET